MGPSLTTGCLLLCVLLLPSALKAEQDVIQQQQPAGATGLAPPDDRPAVEDGALLDVIPEEASDSGGVAAEVGLQPPGEDRTAIADGGAADEGEETEDGAVLEDRAHVDRTAIDGAREATQDGTMEGPTSEDRRAVRDEDNDVEDSGHLPGDRELADGSANSLAGDRTVLVDEDDSVAEDRNPQQPEESAVSELSPEDRSVVVDGVDGEEASAATVTDRASPVIGKADTEDRQPAGKVAADNGAPAAGAYTEDREPAGEVAAEDSAHAGGTAAEDRAPTGGAAAEDRVPAGGAAAEDRAPTGGAAAEDRVPAGGTAAEDRAPTGGAAAEDRVPAGGTAAEDREPTGGVAAEDRDLQDTKPTTPMAPAAPESSAELGEPSISRSATQWFRLGVDAYLSDDWATCSRALENALVEWHHFRKANVACRLRCAAEARAAQPLYQSEGLAGNRLDGDLFDDDDDLRELRRGEELVRATLCILKCKRRAFRGHATTDAMPAAEQKVFRDLKPYEYLQLCYFQTSELQKAASAVFTILSHDPENEMMKHNLKFYLSTSDIDIQSVTNYESEKYAQLFLSGIDAYYAENYSAAIKNLEASITEFLQAINECRADCEGPFDQGWLPDFTSSVANHFVFCLKCKAKCPSKLNQLNGEKYADFLPSHYNYLQFAYFKRGKLREAVAAAATYLMFFPADEAMLENIDYYKSLPQVDTSMFQPRQEAVIYIKRHSYEDLLLKYIADEFVFTDKHDKEIHQQEEININGRSKSLFDKRKKSLEEHHSKVNFLREHEFLKSNSDAVREQSKSVVTELMKTEVDKQNGPLGIRRKRGLRKGNHQEETYRQETLEAHKPESLPLQGKPAIKESVYNFQGEEFLGGAQRFMVDGLADTSECQRLIWLAKASGVRGDGYDGNKSPHSSQEIFDGVTLGRTALMVYFGLIDLTTLQLFLNLSERGRKIVATYFNVPINHLFFSFTHLVCRSSRIENSQNNTYLSHAIHADNCSLKRDGVCNREEPAYYWRDYSAILYLNENFEGGEFIFSADPLGHHIESSIKPTCGRLVGFSSGRENLHGVRGVRAGSRCALALWFTLDPNHREWGRTLTEELIQNLEMGNQPHNQVIDDLKRFVQFDLEEAKMQMSKVAFPLNFQQNFP